jgi:hypothetical protein
VFLVYYVCLIGGEAPGGVRESDLAMWVPNVFGAAAAFIRARLSSKAPAHLFGALKHPAQVMESAYTTDTSSSNSCAFFQRPSSRLSTSR